MREATYWLRSIWGHAMFQSTPPMREATRARAGCSRRTWCFNPRLPCGRRRPDQRHIIMITEFQSTPPMREATQGKFGEFFFLVVSIHASHAGGDIRSADVRFVCGVSIHASHAGGDNIGDVYFTIDFVSIHASHAGGDMTRHSSRS